MTAPTISTYDEALLDALARVFMEAALQRMVEQSEKSEMEKPTKELAE